MNKEYIERETVLSNIYHQANRSSLGEFSPPYLDWEDVVFILKDATAADVVSRELFEQIKWERDIAMTQLKEYGICFGAKKTGDLVEVRHGYWKDNLNGTFTCSECEGKSSKMDWCGRCGAKMDGGKRG